MAARSTSVTLKNQTTALLVLTDSGVSHGIWNPRPPTVISPGTQATWQNESNGFMTGDEGYATYTMVLGSTSVGEASVSWDNPFIGSNSYGVACPPGFTISYTGGSGNNAAIVVSLAIKADALATTERSTVEK